MLPGWQNSKGAIEEIRLANKEKKFLYWTDIKEKERRKEMNMKIRCKGEQPSYANSFAAGLDLKSNEDVVIHPGQIIDIKSMLAVEIPHGYFGMIVARSGLSYKRQIKLINDVGIIDEDYRGDIGIRLINEGQEKYQIKKGDRIAQMIIVPYIQPKLVFVDELEETQRGEKGFGSTGR